MASFQRAVELGSTFIETDLQVTGDGHFVAIHDHTVDRTTNGSGKVGSFTLDALRQLDAGLWFDREFMGERLPMLEEIIDFSEKNEVAFYLELKYLAVPGMDQALAAAMRKLESAARTIVISFDASVLAALRRIDPAITMGFLVEDIGPDSIPAALDLGVRQLCPEFSAVDGKFVEQAHRAGLPVVPWTVNGADEMRAMIAAGVDGIMTDFPDRLRAVIEDLQARQSVG